MTPGARVDFLESMLQWHLGNSTSTDLVLREVQDAIVQEVTSFPVEKVAFGESPSVAMHVPISLLRAAPAGDPATVADMGAASVALSGRAAVEALPILRSADGDALLSSFPAWDGWTKPSVALTLRAVLMTSSALAAAAGMQQPMIGIGGVDKDDDAAKAKAGKLGDEGGSSGGSGSSSPSAKASGTPRRFSKSRPQIQILFPEGDSGVDATRLREFYETLWPDAPYSFGTYDRYSVKSDTSYLKGEETTKTRKTRRRGEKRLVVVVNVSSPGDENAAESDGEGMVNAAETLLELGVPFVVLTLWLDNALARSVKSGKPRRAEQDSLRVRMEKRTRILLGRSVKRKEARVKVREAYERAKRAPQGAGYVALEEALAEARDVGADAGEGDAMLREIRADARAAEENALAAALQAACLQVPVDVAGLRANLQRARGILEREDRLAELESEANAVANAAETRDDAGRTADVMRAWNESAARAEEMLSVDEDDVAGEAAEDAVDRGVLRSGSSAFRDGVDSGSGLESASASANSTPAGSALASMEDIDRFVTEGASSGSETGAGGLVALRAAVASAEAALEAAELESDLRATLQDESSLNVSSVPRLENLMLRAAKVAERKPPLTEEGAAKLNTLVSRCFSRATALQEMDGARAALAEALEPSLRGRDLALGGVDLSDATPRLEKAIARAKSSAWPWQLEDAVRDAETVLERWAAIGRVEAALASRVSSKIRREIAYASKAHPNLDLRDARKRLAELDAEAALEGGDQRLKAYFAASKMAWANGAPNAESAEMLATIRSSLDITDAEHEQVTKAVSAGSRTAAEAAAAAAAAEADAAAARAASDAVDARFFGGPGARVSFSASGAGVRGPLFRGSDETLPGDPETQMYVLNWDDPEVELYVGGAGPREGFAGLSGGKGGKGGGESSSSSSASRGSSDPADEAARAWNEAVPDEGSAGEEVTVVSGGGDVESGGAGSRGASSSSSSTSSSSGWRRVGDSIVYNEEEVIGVGSSGTYVFRGYVQHTTRARHAVAVKRIQRPPGEEGRELLKLVEREVELLTALNQSPRVPFFHCWGITSSHVFIALELCTESLREHVARRGASMPVERRMEILRSVAAGIAWLHDPNKPSGCITHNDLKPENLLVDSTGAVKIADVGLGVQLQVGRGDEYTMSTFRKYGIDIVLAGRAPEMLRHLPLTPAADIWAMGVVFYFVLTGRASPFSESGRDVPTDAAIINGRHHLQNLMHVPGLRPRRALESRHLLASMLAPAPESRPDAAGVTSHPLFWDDERMMDEVTALHARSASLQRDLGATLSDVATEALLAGADAGNSERGALLAAATMDLVDWKRMVDDAILTRVTTAHVGPGPVAGGGRPKTDVGRKPYRDGFADLLRFCRNAYEHPPTGDEVEPIVAALAEAERAERAEAKAKAVSAAAARRAQAQAQARARARARGDDEETRGDEDETESETADEGLDAEEGSGVGGARSFSLLPPGIAPGGAHRRLTRKQRKALFAAYVAHLFPGLPLAVYECQAAIGPDVARGARRGGRGGGRGGGNGAGDGNAHAAAAAAETPSRTSNR